MGIIQENRNGVTGPKKVTIDYGVENVDVTGKNGNNKNELSKEEAEKKARLFSDLMTIILVKKKFKPGDERIEEFGHRMNIIVKDDSIEIPKPDDIVKVLKEVGLTDIADAYEKVLAGTDIEAVVEDMPDLPEETPAGDDVVDAGDDTENGDNADASDGDNGNVDTGDDTPADASEDAVVNTEGTISDEAPATDAPEAKADEAPAEETTERRRPGRPSNKK